LIAATGAAAFFLWRTDSKPPTEERHSPWRAPEPSPTAAASVEPETPVRETSARWNGRVRRVNGHPIVAVGAPCTMEGVLRSNMRHDVSISCGGNVIYRSADPTEPLPSTDSDISASEEPAMTHGTSQAWIALSDDKPRRSGRPKAVIEATGRAEIRGITPGKFVVEIGFEPYSEPYDGAFDPRHERDELRFKERIRASGSVTQASGPAPAKLGERCEATMRPTFAPHCRVAIRCGGRLLYGDPSDRSGDCDVANGRPTRFDEPLDLYREGILWDVEAGKIRIDSAERDRTWSLELTVEATR